MNIFMHICLDELIFEPNRHFLAEIEAYMSLHMKIELADKFLEIEMMRQNNAHNCLLLKN